MSYFVCCFELASLFFFILKNMVLWMKLFGSIWYKPWSLITSNKSFSLLKRPSQPLSMTFIQATTGCSPQCSSSWPETWSARWLFCSTCPLCLSPPSSGRPGFMPLWVYLPLVQENMSAPDTELLYPHYRYGTLQSFTSWKVAKFWVLKRKLNASPSLF